jgi:hypothetical protein
MATAHKIIKVSDRVERAKAFLLSQFKDMPNINALVDVLVTEIQELENALADMQDARTLKGAYGAFLDEIGNQLKVDRGNYADDDYKTAIKIAMAKKTSSATTEDILYIVNLLTNDDAVRMENNYPYLMELTGYLFCIADDPAGLSALADLFPVNTRIRLIQRFNKPFKFGTAGQGFGGGATINSLAYHRYGNTNDSRFTTTQQAIIPPALTTPPFNLVVPFITGSNLQGSTLTSTTGEWGGDEPITITYQWLRNGVNISGATDSEYIVIEDDLSASIVCRVTATNDYGSAVVNTNTIIIEDTAPPLSVLTSNIGMQNIYSATGWNNTGPVTTTATLSVNSDGTTLRAGVSNQNDQWLSTTGAGLGSDYTISYIIVDGNAFPNLNPSVPHNLASNISFAVSTTSNGNSINTGTYTFTIRNSLDGAIVQSNTITMTAEIIDTIN